MSMNEYISNLDIDALADELTRRTQQSESWMVHATYVTDLDRPLERDEVVTYHRTEDLARGHECILVDQFVKNPQGRTSMRTRVIRIAEVISDLEIEYDEVAPRQ